MSLADTMSETTMSTDSHHSLAAAKMAVMREVGYVKKGRSDGLRYSYAQEPEIIAALRPAMVDHGILMSPVGVEVLTQETWNTQKGGTQLHVVIVRRFEFKHVSTGEVDVVEVVGEACDTGDKAFGKAMTHAKKYALREYFLIETGDDPDVVAESRGSPNLSTVRRCSALLAGSKNPKSLADAMEKVNQYHADGKLEDSQLEGLRNEYLDLREAMEKTSAKSS